VCTCVRSIISRVATTHAHKVPMFTVQRPTLRGRTADAARSIGGFTPSIAEVDTNASAVCKKQPAATTATTTFFICLTSCCFLSAKYVHPRVMSPYIMRFFSFLCPLFSFFFLFFQVETQCVRGVLDPPVSAFSLSLYRHPFLYTLFSSRFTLIINNNTQ
jgi:hypothetical protein